MIIERTIVFARSRDGSRVETGTFGIHVDDRVSRIDACAIDPQGLALEVRMLWRSLASALPAHRRAELQCEAGIVREGEHDVTYTLAHCNGAILGGNAEAPAWSGTASTVRWADRPPDATLVLGPSATLALVDFILDGIPGQLEADHWPFAQELVIEDTSASPYPPQHRDMGVPIRLGPENLAPRQDDPTFMLLQRSERWQRPVSALYNISRRNLAIGWQGKGPLIPRRSALVLDTLTTESEPTLAPSNWLATWYLDDPLAGRDWGEERLEVRIETAAILRTVCPVGPSRSGCICDPIEGEIFGVAPALAVSSSLLNPRAISP